MAETDGKQFLYPDMKTLLDMFGQRLSSGINCVSIGTVKTFYSSTQTADIAINYMKRIKGKGTDKEGKPIDTFESYPILVNCPVVWLFGGAGFLTFPIAAGDECVVLFCDRDIDNWYSSGSSATAPNSARLHSLSDGIAIVGLKSLISKKTDYNASAVQLGYGSTVITMNASGATIYASGSLGITSTGNTTVSVGGNMSATVTGSATVTATGAVVISGSSVSLNPS